MKERESEGGREGGRESVKEGGRDAWKEREERREGGKGKRGGRREGGKEGRGKKEREKGRKRRREEEREGKNLLHFLVSFLSLSSSHLLSGLVPAELGAHNVHNPRQSFICCLNVQKGQPGPPGQHIDSSARVLANGILHFGFNVGEYL